MIGVDKKQVTIPVVFEKQLLIPTPLSPFTAKILLVISDNPIGVSNNSTEDIEEPCISAFSTPVSYLLPVSGLIRTKLGAELYPLPPPSISISEISFLSITVTIGDTKASGFKVLSAEKSNPGSSILICFILPTRSESGIISALIPSVDPILTNLGSFL